jgi:hypothetical protein
MERQPDRATHIRPAPAIAIRRLRAPLRRWCREGLGVLGSIEGEDAGVGITAALQRRPPHY